MEARPPWERRVWESEEKEEEEESKRGVRNLVPRRAPPPPPPGLKLITVWSACITPNTKTLFFRGSDNYSRPIERERERETEAVEIKFYLFIYLLLFRDRDRAVYVCLYLSLCFVSSQLKREERYTETLAPTKPFLWPLFSIPFLFLYLKS